MQKVLIISSSNELVRVMPHNIAYISAEGNYSIFKLIDNTEVVFSFNLLHSHELIVRQLGEDASCFLRIGKSIIVNRDYIFKINPSKQQLVLADKELRHKFDITASKEALRQVKLLVESEI